MFHTARFSVGTFQPLGGITGSKDVGDTGFKECVDPKSIGDFDAGLFSQRGARFHADTDDDQICGQHAAALQRDGVRVDAHRRALEMEPDAVLLMQGPDERAQFGAKNLLQRERIGSDDMDIQPAPKGRYR